jgi:hypothetical protein
VKPKVAGSPLGRVCFSISIRPFAGGGVVVVVS